MRFLKKIPVQILIAVVVGCTLHPVLPPLIIQALYSVSLCLKDLLMLVLPVLIFFYLTASLSSFRKAAPLMVMSLFALVALSNAFAALTAYGAGLLTIPTLCHNEIIPLASAAKTITPLFHFPLRPFIKNEWALFAGTFLGIALSLFPFQKGDAIIHFVHRGRDIATQTLKKVLIPLLPFYVLGFALKLMHEGSLFMLLKSYSKIFAVSSSLIVAYVFMLYMIGTKFSIRKALDAIKNMLPAGLTGFSTMSSAVAMPFTLSATEKNTGDPAYAQFVVPSTANIHMIGDGLNINLAALSLIVMSGCALPPFEVYLVFTLYYCLAKFSAAGVPAGGMIVVLPVLEKHLSLSPELTTLVATIYILQDSFATGSNIMANGAFAMVTRNIFKKVGWLKNV